MLNRHAPGPLTLARVRALWRPSQALQRPSPAGGSAPWPPSSRLWLRPDCRTLVVPGRLAARHVFGPVVARVVQLAAGVAAEGAEGGRAPNKVRGGRGGGTTLLGHRAKFVHRGC